MQSFLFNNSSQTYRFRLPLKLGVSFSHGKLYNSDPWNASEVSSVPISKDLWLKRRSRGNLEVADIYTPHGFEARINRQRAIKNSYTQNAHVKIEIFYASDSGVHLTYDMSADPLSSPSGDVSQQIFDHIENLITNTYYFDKESRHVRRWYDDGAGLGSAYKTDGSKALQLLNLSSLSEKLEVMPNVLLNLIPNWL